MSLDSPWVVSYTCVIHHDAVFLTVIKLHGPLLKTNPTPILGVSGPVVKMVDAPRLPMGGFLYMRNTL